MTRRTLTLGWLAPAILAGCGTAVQPPPVPAPAAVHAEAPSAPVAAPPAPRRQETAGFGALAPVIAPVGPSGMGWTNQDRLVFASNRRPGEGNKDIYVYDPALDTVLALVGVNTLDNELNPRAAASGRYVVFQRTLNSALGPYRPAHAPQQDILLYDTLSRLVNTLPMLNTEAFDEFMPDVSQDGSKIVYASNQGGYAHVRLHDLKTGDTFMVPGSYRHFQALAWPALSDDGNVVAYAASVAPFAGVATDGTGNPTGGGASMGGALTPGQSDLYVYDVASGTQLTPPFANTAFDELDPDLSGDGRRLLFVSNRHGTADVFEADLDSGFVDDLSLLNTDELDETRPRYLGGSLARLAFQIKPAGQPGPLGVRAFHRTSGTLDTLPVVNRLFSDTTLLAPQPVAP